MADNVQHQGAWLAVTQDGQTHWLNPRDISRVIVTDNGDGTNSVRLVLTGGGEVDLSIDNLVTLRDTIEGALAWRNEHG